VASDIWREPGEAEQRMISEAELDALLLSFCAQRFLKVARIASKTLQALADRGITPTNDLEDQIDARLAALVDSGRIEAKGNIKRWRFSELRLPGAEADTADIVR
jgi:hypothetical protein